MAIRSLKTGTFTRSGMAGNPVIMPGSYESIATASPGGSASFTFSSIPSTYTHLQIRFSDLKTSSGDTTAMRFNADSGANYARHYLYGNGATVTASASTADTGFRVAGAAGSGSTTNPFGTVVDILDYANANKYKTIRSLSGVDSNGSGEIALISGLWLNTAAVTSITIYAGSNFANNTVVALYGIA